MDKFELLYEQILEMAKPSEIIKERNWFHGVKDFEKIKQILQDKRLKKPSIEFLDKKYGKYRPEKALNRVYLSKHLKNALIYSFGANMLGQPYIFKLLSDIDRVSALFVITGKQLSDVQPDEDEIGEIVYDLLNRSPIHFKELDVNSFSWLRRMANEVLTTNQFQKVKDGNYKDLIIAGKKLLKKMNDWQKIEILKITKNLSENEDLKFKTCIVFDKMDQDKLSTDPDLKELKKIGKIVRTSEDLNKFVESLKSESEEE